MKKEYSMLREIKRLKSVRGYGTELITVYIPAGFNLAEETGKLREEHSQSGNIKSKSVRTNVQSALDKILQYLKLYRETPKNGLAIFCGNVSDNPGKVDIELFSMEPPLPLKVNIYRCDSTFMLEPIEDIVGSKDTYLIIVMDGREATIATLKGAHIQVIKKLNSMVHAKVRKGGQSAQRYQRVIEEEIGEYHGRVSDISNSTFQQSNPKLKGVLLGGPGPAKETFAKHNSLNYQLKILGMYDTGYTDEYGLHEVVEKAADLLKEQEAFQERKILERFMQEMRAGGMTVHGFAATKAALEKNQVATLIISSGIDSIIKRRCSKCAEDVYVIMWQREGQSSTDLINKKLSIEKNADPEAERTHAKDGGICATVDIGVDRIEELIDLADKTGSDTTFVSSESSYGKEFLMGFTGIGALLRYRI